jgi:ABC-type Fe3+-hydroxamate transport system substrate-binding protein
MKVISLVPSWTELLISAGVNVVGRTRFCIHPSASVRSIAAVGGTKDLDWAKIEALKADLLILDQEENLPWMRDQSPIPTLVTHVTSVRTVSGEIEKMAEVLFEHQSELNSVAQRWSQASAQSFAWNWQKIPGEIETLRRDFEFYEKLVYVIWKNPWMRVSKRSFIASMLENLGAEAYLVDDPQKYPEFEVEKFNRPSTYFLFSSEPFPFQKKKQELLDLGVQGSIVDGESYSWFGLRSLQFLESLIAAK